MPDPDATGNPAPCSPGPGLGVESGLMSKGEDRLIRWIARRCPIGRGVKIGIGDDMASVRVGSREFLITVDMLMDGVDFDLRRHAPRRVGRKAMAASLSDCAAMAVRPRHALVSVALPDKWTMRQAGQLYRGLSEMAHAFGCTVIGGDTNSWRQPLVIDVIVLAESWPGTRPIRRDGMRPGDAVCVTGVLGGSIAGHHLDFTPRVAEARSLARQLGRDLHAMMDLSDGLSTDADRLAAASGCGIELFEQALLASASAAARRMGRRDSRSVVDHVLNDGEDFELLFAASPCSLPRITLGCPWRQVGVATAGRGLWLCSTTGRRRLRRGGWEHWRG